jgi:hypothetical protein
MNATKFEIEIMLLKFLSTERDKFIKSVYNSQFCQLTREFCGGFLAS